jgi:hypothetical protein
MLVRLPLQQLRKLQVRPAGVMDEEVVLAVIASLP